MSIRFQLEHLTLSIFFNLGIRVVQISMILFSGLGLIITINIKLYIPLKQFIVFRVYLIIYG